MRLLLISAVAGLMAMNVSAMAASSAQNTMKTCSASWKTKSDTDKKATTYKAYMSTCMKGTSTASTQTSAMTATPASTMAAAPAKSGGSMATCAASWKTMSDTAKKATTYKTYMSGCMKGSNTASVAPANTMMAAPKTAAPAMAVKPAKSAMKALPGKSAIPTEGHTGTSARCKDGTVVQIKSHMGACSRHGGVAAWL